MFYRLLFVLLPFLEIVWSIHLRITASDYAFGISKLVV